MWLVVIDFIDDLESIAWMQLKVSVTQKGKLFDKLLQLNERIKRYFLDKHALINCAQIKKIKDFNVGIKLRQTSYTSAHAVDGAGGSRELIV